MKIFVIHYDKLTERKTHIINQFEEQKLDDYEIISNKGKDVLTIEEKSKFQDLKDTEISLFLHHIECYKQIIENNYDYAIIFEDDIVFKNNNFK
jgi:GR25 family glycosyltransferase involved in LPS biosynthesis